MKESNKNHERIVKLNEGDPKALESYFHDFYAALIHFAMSLIHDRMEAEDKVVEVFTKLWKNRYQFSDTMSVKAFLYVSVRNACINHLHKTRRWRKVDRPMEYLEGFLKDMDLVHMVDPKIVGKEILIELINDAIGKLPPKMKAISEFIKQGFSTRQISEIMNVSEANVRVQKARAIKAIKLMLSGRNPFRTELYPVA